LQLTPCAYKASRGHLEKPLRVWQNVGASNLT
jgi:hypothetical protein